MLSGIIQSATKVALITALLGGIWLAINLLPIQTIPPEIVNGLVLIYTYASVFNFLLPFDHMFLALAFIMTVHGVIILWSFLRWLVAIIATASN